MQANSEKEYGKVWELLKFEIRTFSIQFGKQLAMKKVCIQDIIRHIISKLTQMHLHEKARGAFVRSRTKWMDKGEKNSRSFLKKEMQK